MNILVLGFYDRDNLGDESYKYAFPKIIGKENIIKFVCMDDVLQIPKDIDIVICGGGDIINDYFMIKARKLLINFTGRVYALSVGIPYESGVKYLHMFDHVFVRSTNDYELACKEIGKENVTLYPDAVMSLHFVPRPTSQKQIKKIGLCLAQPLFHNNPKKEELITGIIDACKLLQVVEYEIHLLPFNTHDQSISENDQIISNEIHCLLKDNAISSFVHSELKNPFDMLKFIDQHLDITICMRYHSVVFSTMIHVPFVALYSSQKIDNLLKDLKHDPCCGYKLDTDNMFRPIVINADKLYTCIAAALNKSKDYLMYGTIDTSLISNIISSKKSAHILYKNKPPPLEDVMVSCKQNLSKFLEIDPTLFESLMYTRGTFPLNGKPSLDLARFICFLISGNMNDPCIWGLADNLKTNAFCLGEAIEFIWKQIQETVEIYYPKLNIFQKRIFLNVDSLFNNSFSQYHRSGWGYVVGGLMNLDASTMSRRSDTLFDTYVDRSFHWGLDILVTLGILPYTQSWYGVIHHTFDTTHSDYNCEVLFKNEIFLKSLDVCKGLIVLSEYLANQIREALKRSSKYVPVYVVYHPMENVGNMFTMSKFLQNHNRRIVQIGAWLRNPYAIYALPLPVDGGVLKIKKTALKGKEMDHYFPPCEVFQKMSDVLLNDEWGYSKKDDKAICRSSNNINKFCQGLLTCVQNHFQSVDIINRLDNDAYDELLSKNIVFLNLIDCSAVNTVLECIVRNTILLVNRHPAMEELLGIEYPGFYSDLIEASAICQDELRLFKIHYYLTMLDKERYRLDYFVQCVQDIITDPENHKPSQNLFKAPQKLMNIFQTKYQTLSKYLPETFYTY